MMTSEDRGPLSLVVEWVGLYQISPGCMPTLPNYVCMCTLLHQLCEGETLSVQTYLLTAVSVCVSSMYVHSCCS